MSGPNAERIAAALVRALDDDGYLDPHIDARAFEGAAEKIAPLIRAVLDAKNREIAERNLEHMRWLLAARLAALAEARRRAEEARASERAMAEGWKRSEERGSEARRERDEARGDLAVYRAANLTCGQSLTTLSLGMAPTHTQGCGLVIADGKDVFRCRDCEVPFHRSCLNRHCDDELATERAALAEARRALEDARATIRNLREVVVSNQDARRDVENLLEQCGRSLAEAQRDRDEVRAAAEYAIERCTESHIIASLPCERCRPWRAALGRPAPDGEPHSAT